MGPPILQRAGCQPHLITEAFREGKKEPAASYSRTGESRTTLGDGALNFCVRNGNRCDSSSMATGKKTVSWELKRLTTHHESEMISLQVKFEI